MSSFATIVAPTGVAACKHGSGPELRGPVGTGNLAKLFLTDLGLFLEAAHRGEG